MARVVKKEGGNGGLLFDLRLSSLTLSWWHKSDDKQFMCHHHESGAFSSLSFSLASRDKNAPCFHRILALVLLLDDSDGDDGGGGDCDCDDDVAGISCQTMQ